MGNNFLWLNNRSRVIYPLTIGIYNPSIDGTTQKSATYQFRGPWDDPQVIPLNKTRSTVINNR